MIDLGQYDAVKPVKTDAANHEAVFYRFRERLNSERARLNLARYLLAYLEEERARGVKRADEWTIADAIEAWQGGAE